MQTTEALPCKRKKPNLTGFFNQREIEQGEKKGTYHPGKDELIGYDKGESCISVEDYANEMLNQVEKTQHNMERLTIG
jgi:putative NADH-flavin reductase